KSTDRRQVHELFTKLSEAYRINDAVGFQTAAAALTNALRALNSEVYPRQAELDVEVFYEDANAFGRAWQLYAASFILVLLFGFSRRRVGYIAGAVLLSVGLVCHTLGIGLRWYIAGRAPVSDMYESLIFMGWGIAAIGLLLEGIYRKRFFALAASLLGFLSLAFAEHLPLDSAINPLVPVLANTSWLAIHVMTVMLSYSAFALTMALGHIVLAIQLFQPGKTDLLRSLSQLLYKTLQVGLLFLVAGIVFGAIWANESWGRYWGWDPKETWSLITFFVYLAIVHARFAGWLHNFGMAVCSILGFLSVLMTYYGVNYILGAGLHSYGFSAGGEIYATIFLAVETLVILVVFRRYRTAIAPATEPA
ncbi:MAG: c-type cytochrome biogenesis protein CcsB, partial [Planctomycetota bacterium]